MPSNSTWAHCQPGLPTRMAPRSTLNYQRYRATLIPSMSITMPRASSSSLPSVRVANGGTLPYDRPGLTVVTPDPLYVLGNFNANGSSLNNGTNVVNALPAAADGRLHDRPFHHPGVTATPQALPSVHEPQVPPPSTLPPLKASSPPPAPITAAAWKISFGCWKTGPVNLTYNGSIVVMFPSQYATNAWHSARHLL